MIAVLFRIRDILFYFWNAHVPQENDVGVMRMIKICNARQLKKYSTHAQLKNEMIGKVDCKIMLSWNEKC